MKRTIQKTLLEFHRGSLEAGEEAAQEYGG